VSSAFFTLHNAPDSGGGSDDGGGGCNADADATGAGVATVGEDS